MANRIKFTTEKKEEICEAIKLTGNITKACDMCNVSKTAAYDHKEIDPIFSKAWDQAVEDSIELMEAEARRRAVEGVLEPVYYQGVVVGEVLKYSDTLLMFMIKGAKPEKYRDNSSVTIGGDANNPLKVDYKHDPAKAAEEIIKAHGMMRTGDAAVDIEVE